MQNFTKYNRQLSNEERTTMNTLKDRVSKGTNQYEYPEPIQGTYIAQIDNMEIKEVKNKLSFLLRFKLLEGTNEDTAEFVDSWPGHNSPKIPYSRPITGTRNDASCLGSVLGLLNGFVETEDITFDGDYDVFAETVADIFQAVKDDYAYEISYNPDDFYRFKILGILKSEEEGAEEHSAPEKEDETPVSDEREESYDPQNKVKPKDIQMPTSMPTPSQYDHSEFISSDEFYHEDEDDYPF